MKRTGDLGKHLFPKYCMLCRKETPIQVNRKKQYPKLISLDSAEEAIKEAAHMKKDDTLLAAIEGVPSLQAADFVYTKSVARSTLEFVHLSQKGRN